MDKRIAPSIVIKKNKKERKTNLSIFKIILKTLLILFVVYGFYIMYNSYSNSISLLAVSEDKNGNTVSGSIVKLNLEIRPGSGQIYTNLNTIEEIDTQISIINSQKIACNLFSLPCEKYDFYFNFEGSALVLKGPSASSAIAILTAKTVKKEQIENDVVITGSLNSGGIIGSVGGIEEKIIVADEYEFKKVLIPEFSSYNLTSLNEKNLSIEIIPVFDLIEAYNNFNGKEYELKIEQINNEEYLKEMEKLSDSICLRSNELKEKINFSLIEINSTEENYKLQAEKSYNYSQNAKNISNYYSRGSFCYNSNLNYRLLFEKEQNLSIEQRDEKIEELKKEINEKYVKLMSEDYKNNLETTNDFYVYLLMIDRIEESKEYLKEAEKLKIESISSNDDVKITIIDANITINNNPNENISKIKNKNIIDEKNLKNQSEIINSQKMIYYSYANERYYTVLVWEEFITHSGTKIKFNDDKISESCHKINREIQVKSELLKNYDINFLNEEISKQNEFENPFSNKYHCLYSGIELNGKINTVLNTFGIDNENQKNYTLTLLEFANNRVSLNSRGDFPLIPYMYSEYAKDLYSQDDLGSAMLYSNYALSYNDLNLYLDEEKKNISYINESTKKLFSNPFFVFLILLLIAII